MKKKYKIIALTVFILIIIFFSLFFYNEYINYQENYAPVVPSPVASSSVSENMSKENKGTEVCKKLFYETLNEDEKKVYDKIYKCTAALAPKVYISTDFSGDDVFRIFVYMLNDHPEIFWCFGGGSFSSDGWLEPEYSCSKEKAKEETELINSKAQEIIKSLYAEGDDYSKALAVFEYISKNTAYDNDEAEKITESDDVLNYKSHSIAGVFLNSCAVCSGYSKAYQYLLEMVGISSAYISGTSLNNHHAWLVININGDNYYSDVTWGDQYEPDASSKFIDHYYFIMDRDQLLRDHKFDEICDVFSSSSNAENYFVKENLLFYEYDYKKILYAVKANCSKYDNDYIEIMAADDAAYEDIVYNLIEKTEADKLMKNAIKKSCNSYIKNDEQRTLILLQKSSDK
ncbi:MAG: hypothetical protein NC213_09520 [Acetobacter sp.]|nr:hypothetical protein [Bacteroides sp.]MCM1341969.1 hypothetical protein [Acetobacter sp.]MCM1434154.1 hypothetical protein [Clostridiales bacterium]